MKYVIRYVKPHIPTMIFGFTIKFTGTILDLMIPYILSYIIDEVTPRNDIGLVIRWGLMMRRSGPRLQRLGQPGGLRRFQGFHRGPPPRPFL